MAGCFWGASFFCILAILGVAQGHANFEIHGRVYCDPCRVRFETRLSYPLDGVMIGLECKNLENGSVSLKTEAKTFADGTYKLEAPGDHEDDLCEVILRESSSDQCIDVMPNGDRDRVSLTTDAGVAGKIRYANDLGYMTKDVNEECPRVMDELAFVPDA